MFLRLYFLTVLCIVRQSDKVGERVSERIMGQLLQVSFLFFAKCAENEVESRNLASERTILMTNLQQLSVWVKRLLNGHRSKAIAVRALKILPKTSCARDPGRTIWKRETRHVVKFRQCGEQTSSDFGLPDNISVRQVRYWGYIMRPQGRERERTKCDYVQ